MPAIFNIMAPGVLVPLSIAGNRVRWHAVQCKIWFVTLDDAEAAVIIARAGILQRTRGNYSASDVAVYALRVCLKIGSAQQRRRRGKLTVKRGLERVFALRASRSNPRTGGHLRTEWAGWSVMHREVIRICKYRFEIFMVTNYIR